MNNTRIPGVLGGLGPEASVDFMSRVLAATNADSDQQHIRMLIDHNPTVPNRHAAIAGDAPSVAPQLIAMAQGLEQSGADFLVMVCNTAHAYSDEIQSSVSIPFISIIDVTVAAIADQPGSRVGVMAASGCLQANLYQDALQAAGHEAICWDEQALEQFMALVYRIKAGQRSPEITSSMQRLAAVLEFDGADILIAGCTEIPLVLNAGGSASPMLSSTDLLVAKTIELARGQCSLPD